MLTAHSHFHDLLPGLASEYPGPVRFSALGLAESVEGRPIWGLSVTPSIRETINRINDWCQQLHIWNIWLHVLPELSDEEKWELESAIIEPIGFFCMLQPATNSDRLRELAESLLHQANLIVVEGYVDKLDQDSRPAGRNLSRKESLAQLDRLGQAWTAYKRFKDFHRQINGKAYSEATGNFRNRAVHSLASRWSTGDILCAVRSVVPWEEIVKHPDGTYQLAPHRELKVVQYEFGVRMPLEMAEAHAQNLKQYRLVKKAMTALEVLASESVTAIHAKGVRLNPASAE